MQKGISIFEEMQTNSAYYKPLKLSNMKENVTLESLFAQIGKLVDDFLADIRREINAQNYRLDGGQVSESWAKDAEKPIAQEIETTSSSLLDSREDRRYISDMGEEILKKNGICHTRQSYSSISFYFSLLEGNNRPKRIERDESFLNILSQHIIANSRFGLSHVDLWNEIASHYSLKSRKGKMFSRSQAEGLVGYLYLEKGATLAKAFGFIDKFYVKGINYSNACYLIGEVLSTKPRKEMTKEKSLF